MDIIKEIFNPILFLIVLILIGYSVVSQQKSNIEIWRAQSRLNESQSEYNHQVANKILELERRCK